MLGTMIIYKEQEIKYQRSIILQIFSHRKKSLFVLMSYSLTSWEIVILNHNFLFKISVVEDLSENRRRQKLKQLHVEVKNQD